MKVINKDGFTPLTLAVSDNTEEMVEFFVRETVRIKQLESNHQQTSVYKTEGRPESLSESSRSLVDKKSEDDSLRSLSSKPNMDDSWPTAEDEDFDFGTKKAINPHLAKLLAGFPRFPKMATVRQLHQELTGTLENQSVSEASLQTTSHSHMNLEDEALDIRKKLDQNTSQNDDCTTKLVTVSSKCLNLDKKINVFNRSQYLWKHYKRNMNN
ncbi:hypothetical protein HJG60_008011 [Phyllostomus discolor]|uniref:CCDC144C-like coiled-coil domain-containing protein n=1 Tax=Phyllostomus discolor TaxID=89673 RepID=A0A834EYF4_9CHIR|nr:hypothetical protein HJG60_008011 [Phyllostomus discolor]